MIWPQEFALSGSPLFLGQSIAKPLRKPVANQHRFAIRFCNAQPLNRQCLEHCCANGRLCNGLKN